VINASRRDEHPARVDESRPDEDRRDHGDEGAGDGRELALHFASVAR
jgi:hypothetical protein